MTNGRVKWFDKIKGYGFIKPEEGNKDVFVHISALEKSGLDTLHEDQRVSFNTEENKGKVSATDVEVLAN